MLKWLKLTILKYLTEMCSDSEMGDDDTFSVISDIGSQIMADTYTLQEINNFLDTTFGKTVEVKDLNIYSVGDFVTKNC